MRASAENASAAVSALARIEAVLPPELAARLDGIALFVPGFRMTAAQRRLLDQMQAACIAHTVLTFHYTRLEEDDSRAEHRTVRPLALVFWSGVWTLASWCETRNDFRSFRVDRIADLEVIERTFVQRRGQRLEDMLKRFRDEGKSQSNAATSSPRA
jgi:predicted DNA-binding transcriptional regulator YafY